MTGFLGANLMNDAAIDASGLPLGRNAARVLDNVASDIPAGAAFGNAR